MKKSRAVIFNFIYQLTIALLILDFQLNPQYLRTRCITAHANSETLGSSQIIDCISCHTLNTKEVSDQFIGYVSILVPLSDAPAAGLNSRLPFDSSQMNKNSLHQKFLYESNIYFQKGCAHYDCQSFHELEDFRMRQKKNVERLNQHNIQQDDAELKVSSYSVPSIRYQLGIGTELETIALESDFLNYKDISSLFLRGRYTVNNRVEGDREPAFLIYQLTTNIYARLILILVVLLESSRLYALLSHYTQCIRNILFGILILGFVSPTTAILSSALAIYLTIGKIYNTGNYGLMASMLFAIFSILSISGRISFAIPILIVFIYSIFVTIKQLREKAGFLEFGTLIGFIITLVFMSQVGWHFYIFLTPLLILGGLLSIRDEKEHKSGPKYDLVSFNDEEEDVLSKIQRQLR